MRKFYTNIVNDKRKNLNWMNVNFFYISTIVFILVLIATFLWCRPVINSLLERSYTWNILFLPFRHLSWIHLFGNIECFLVVSLFLERRYGSFKYSLIISISILLSPLANFVFLGLHGQGASLVNFFLFGIFFVEIFFNFRECFMTKYQNIFTIITIILILLLMSFTDNIQFSPLTTLLTINHGSAFIEGLLVGVLSNLIIQPNKSP